MKKHTNLDWLLEKNVALELTTFASTNPTCYLSFLHALPTPTQRPYGHYQRDDMIVDKKGCPCTHLGEHFENTREIIIDWYTEVIHYNFHHTCLSWVMEVQE